jgi:hypothetical protein
LQDVAELTTKGRKGKGENIWDEEWENGAVSFIEAFDKLRTLQIEVEGYWFTYQSLQKASALQRELSELRTELEYVKATSVPSTTGMLTSRRVDGLQCFVSYRFTGEVRGMLTTLTTFLNLSRVDVLTGAGYEPRSIATKVKEKLDSSALDFVILLISIHGESPWTRDEITRASLRAIPVIPLVEDGAKFEPGLFGDPECIPFSPGRIEETFVKILQAIHFIQQNSRTREQ